MISRHTLGVVEMAKNFEAKAMDALVDTMLKRSNEHGEFMRDGTARLVVYSIRSGRLETINRLWQNMTNGVDKYGLKQSLDHINKTGYSALIDQFEEQDREDLKLLLSSDEVFKTSGRVNIFRFSEKNGIEWVANDEVQKPGQVMRKALQNAFKDDDTMLQAVLPLLESSNEEEKSKASKDFDPAGYLLNAVKKLARDVKDDEQAIKLVKDVNNVIRANFGRDKALKDDAISAIQKERKEGHQKKLDEAMEALKAAGYDIKAPKPSVVVNGEVVKETKGEETPKEASGKVIDHKPSVEDKRKSA